jgi:hypothetical protein
MYWVSGKPGSGKSILMKEMASQYQEKYSKIGSISACHFFNNRGDALERSFDGFLRSILEQILRQEPVLFDCLLKDFREHFEHQCSCCHEGKEIQWTIRRLKIAFKDIMMKGPSNVTICLFVDALDESDRPVREIIIFFRKLIQEAHINIKICFSSRDIPDDLLSTFGKGQGFVLEEQNATDIVNFVSDKLTLGSSGDKTDTDLVVFQELKALKEEIIQKADGVFLWIGQNS